MFSALSQGSLIHILDKTNGIKYKVGEVIGVSQPKNNYGGVYGAPSFAGLSSTIDIKVRVDGSITDYPGVPSSQTTASYNNGNIFISETKQDLQEEIENVLQNSRQAIANIPTYEKSIVDCEAILKTINPQFAKDKERDDRIDGLDSKVTSMENKLDKILNVLSSNNNPGLKL